MNEMRDWYIWAVLCVLVLEQDTQGRFMLRKCSVCDIDIAQRRIAAPRRKARRHLAKLNTNVTVIRIMHKIMVRYLVKNEKNKLRIVLSNERVLL